MPVRLCLLSPLSPPGWIRLFALEDLLDMEATLEAYEDCWSPLTVGLLLVPFIRLPFVYALPVTSGSPASPIGSVWLIESLLEPFVFLRWWARWLAPVGLPRLMEHFWKCLFRMSLREKVSLHRWHMYGRSPVSVDG